MVVPTKNIVTNMSPRALVGWIDDQRGELADALQRKDATDVAHALAYLTQIRSLLDEFNTEVEAGLLSLLTADPVEVDGCRYEKVAKRGSDQWDRNAVILDAVRENADHPDRLAQMLMDILPANVSWRKGKSQDEGMRSYGMNPDDYHTRGEIKGYGLKVTKVDPS